MSSQKAAVGSQAIYNARELGGGRMVVLGLQHMFAMFGATVVVPLITGLDVSTTLLKQDLYDIKYWADYRINKYGDDIIDILNQLDQNYIP